MYTHTITHLGKFAWAIIRDCDKALQLDPLWLWRHELKADALVHLGDYDGAGVMLMIGLRTVPGDDVLMKLLREVRQERLFRRSQAKGNDAKGKINAEFMLKSAAAYEATELREPLTQAELHSVARAKRQSNECKQAIHLEGKGDVRKAIPIYGGYISLRHIHYTRIHRSQYYYHHHHHDNQPQILCYHHHCQYHYRKHCHHHQSGTQKKRTALGRIYFDAEDLEKPDHAKGLYWFERCVHHGPSILWTLLNGGKDPALASAQCDLGQIYRHGLGVEQDRERGLELLRLSADGGDAVGMNNPSSFLAQMGDFKEASAWYKAAAELGYSLAMANMGDFLRQGVGVVKDLREAEKWLRKALAKGCPQASESLAKLKSEAGDYEGEVQQLEDAIEVAQKNGEVQVAMLTHLAHQLFLLQSHEDYNLTIEDLHHLLRDLGTDTPSLSLHEKLNFMQVRNDTCRQYHKLRPVTKREARARMLWDQAVQLGHVQSGIQHGNFLLRKGMDSEALKMFSYAASYLNDADAHYHVGLLFSGRTGSGSMLNEAKSASRLRKASKLGHEAATFSLNVSQPHVPQSNNLAAKQEYARSSLSEMYENLCGVVTKEELSALKNMNNSFIPAMADPDMKDKSLKPGSVADHISILIDYTALHPESFNGLSMLHAYNHYLLFRAIWPPDELIAMCSESKSNRAINAMSSACDHFFLAYTFDDIAIAVEYHVKQDGSGTPTPGGLYASCLYASCSLRPTPTTSSTP
jgi:TPR repeat protein